jgi:hypothetical protein
MVFTMVHHMLYMLLRMMRQLALRLDAVVRGRCTKEGSNQDEKMKARHG